MKQWRDLDEVVLLVSRPSDFCSKGAAEDGRAPTEELTTINREELDLRIFSGSFSVGARPSSAAPFELTLTTD